jgi:diguanylate cyclase (GGDEF)-like protein
MSNIIDTNISYFSRHLDKIRRRVSLACIFLIILATIPVALTRIQSGWDTTSAVQGICTAILITLFFRVYFKGYASIVGVIIYIVDVILMSIVTLDTQGNELIVLFFLTPLLVAYLFFSARNALIFSVLAYAFLSYLYFLQYLNPTEASFTYELTLLIFAGISSIAGLHVVIGLHQSIEEKLMAVAHTDALTALPNRMYFDLRIKQELDRAKRDKTSICLALIDLDFFKKVNDNYGHDGGDRTLIHFTKLIKQSIRSLDTVCRIGGEEFAVIMPNSLIEEAKHTMERVRIAAEETPFKRKQDVIAISTSIGVAGANLNTSSIEELYISADKALYLAKNNGRNQVCTLAD